MQSEAERFVAHGQNWEDVRLRRIFGEQPSGFYIDVGAAHPVLHSFTYTLYEQGWRGVNVEPLPSFFAVLQEERPEDINLRAVLGRTGGSARFFELAEQPGSSTMRTDLAQRLREQGFSLTEHEIPVMSLRSLCERYAPATIDLLKVDVEGAEADVLLGGDWERYRPRVVVVEANDVTSWEPLLLSNGYRLAAFDGINNWYVESADVAWLEVIGPPVSVLDRFIPFELFDEVGRSPVRSPRGSHEDMPRRAKPARRGSRPRLLLALSSANQLYSGTGRVLFETLRRLTSDFEIEAAIDDSDARNVSFLGDFCSEHGLSLHVGSGCTTGDGPDNLNEELGSILDTGAWQIVMGVSWANAATNSVLLEHAGDAAISYLPLHQPVSTVPLDVNGQAAVETTHRAMLVRADVVLCLTPWERKALNDLVAPELPRFAVVPPGCDFGEFLPGPTERSCDLLFVGDQRERRKRFDRVLAVLERVRSGGLDARLLVVGNESERVGESLPPAVAQAVVPLGYVSEERLRSVYAEAAVLLLLSDYEAFGMPIIEALACVTPVVMSEQPAPASLFGAVDGVHFVDGDDADAAAGVVSGLLRGGAAERGRLLARRAQLAHDYDWNTAARRTRDQLLAAWAHRCRMSAGFLPIAD